MRLLAAVLSAAVILIAPAALACINGMKLQVFERKENLVAQAARSYREGRYTEAASAVERGLAANPSDADRRALLRTGGLSNLRLGRFDQSIEQFEALAKEKKEPFVQGKLAESRLRRAEARGTVEGDAQQVLEKLFADGLLSDADSLTALGRARVRAGDVEGAKAVCDEALRVAPEHPEALQLRSSLSKPKPSSEPVKASAKS